MLWTKNGSIPYPYTDGTEGWQPAPDKPDCPEGKEVIWVAPQWIIRDPAPANREGYQWAYFLNEGWVELAIPEGTPEFNSQAASPPLPNANLTSAQLDFIET
jgi:hypothetical protein